MGLAAYGKIDERFNNIFQLLPNGMIKIDERWTRSFTRDMFDNWEHCESLYKNLATTVQRQLEKAVIHMVTWIKNSSGMENLCLCGGAALNCVVNGALEKAQIFKNVFVPPAAGDSSVAIGCAYYGWSQLHGGRKPEKIQAPYWGKSYEEYSKRQSLDLYTNIGLISYTKGRDLSQVAKCLANGEVIAWFQGKSEFGPRALGNRSILCDPGSPLIKDILNKKVKYREAFRPFAPSVPAEHAQNWFNQVPQYSYYMQYVVYVNECCIEKAPAITHKDKTARLHLVRKEDNPLFHELLIQFGKISGYPILLNTSFNIQEPIVETPEQALKTFICSGIDRLVMDNYQITRNCSLVLDRTGEHSQDLLILWHEPVQVAAKLGSDTYFMLRRNALPNDKTQWNSAHHEYPSYKSIRISQHLYQLLCQMNPKAGDIFSISELEKAISFDLTKEWFDIAFLPRVASLLWRKK
jgi:carbamoyltransferase